MNIHKAESFKDFEEKFKFLFDNAADPIFILDNKGRFIQINKKVKEILGYREKDLIGKKFIEMNILTKKSKLIALENFIKRMAGFEIKLYEIEIIKKNGEIVIGEINASTIKENGKTIGDMVICRDITEKRKTEERYNIFFNNVSDAITIVDTKTRKFIDFNNAAEKLTGYSKKELSSMTFDLIHPKEKIREIAASMKKSAETQTIAIMETEILTKDKKRVSVILSGGPIKIGDKMYMQAIFKDITEIKKAQEEIKESEEKYRALINNIPAIVMNVDQNGKIMFINYTLPGFTIEKTIGKTIYDFIPPKYHDNAKKTIKQVFKTGKASIYETIGAGPEGEMRYYSTVVGPIKQEKKVVSVILISSDITEKKKTEEELRRSREVLQSKVEELEKFNKIAIGRELKMVELKKRIGELERQLDKGQEKGIVIK
jgi:two-component system sporulation sensor kinase A